MVLFFHVSLRSALIYVGEMNYPAYTLDLVGNAPKLQQCLAPQPNTQVLAATFTTLRGCAVFKAAYASLSTRRIKIQFDDTRTIEVSCALVEATRPAAAPAAPLRLLRCQIGYCLGGLPPRYGVSLIALLPKMPYSIESHNGPPCPIHNPDEEAVHRRRFRNSALPQRCPRNYPVRDALLIMAMATKIKKATQTTDEEIDSIQQHLNQHQEIRPSWDQGVAELAEIKQAVLWLTDPERLRQEAEKLEEEDSAGGSTRPFNHAMFFRNKALGVRTGIEPSILEEQHAAELQKIRQSRRPTQEAASQAVRPRESATVDVKKIMEGIMMDLEKLQARLLQAGGQAKASVVSIRRLRGQCRERLAQPELQELNEHLDEDVTVLICSDSVHKAIENASNQFETSANSPCATCGTVTTQTVTTTNEFNSHGILLVQPSAAHRIVADVDEEFGDWPGLLPGGRAFFRDDDAFQHDENLCRSAVPEPDSDSVLRTGRAGRRGGWRTRQRWSGW
ncbi:hypothetical protein FN846DRAFT_889764 [Sphaerosporella brunnea]|uniref:Uncharacterized protein n=1 Tax=Sphaerosporella brunnea TaxID=1250544 RepID=A0A5J5EYQ8_9PEZI|nr:hypothetical protein FN846DRAFT_889764 [Sphaerosporella brunnea]